MTTLTARPSGSAVWLACPMGLTMQNRYGNRYPAGAAAEEGTAAHWVKEKLRAGNTVSVGDAAPNGVAVTRDMLTYGAQANSYLDKLADGGKVFTELNIEIKFGKYTIKGTVDDVALPPDGRSFHQVDYKYGYTHVPADSSQNRIYGIGLRQRFVRERGTLHIVQPRDYTAKPTRSWVFTPIDQLDFCQKVERALDAAHEKNPVAIPGKHCLRCPGAGPHCSASWDTAMSAASGLTRQMENSPESVGRMLRVSQDALDVVTAVRKGLEDEASHILRGGGLVPGWSMQSKPGREKWTDEQPVLDLAAGFGLLDTVSERRLITPNQAIKAGLPAELVRMHTTRPQGEAKLVPTGETLAARIFGETT
ncbi:MAG: DUF2800 domain-containing protein [Gordonibacter sp.]|uniref:DUF2800 domain-containing protein n=1 Tax=Gordonibacter sp. TaxID=1968902 RepID=UPI002FCBD20E